jgi:hypothetical protein
MNWDAVGAIGQVLGSLAVFVTLAYLAIQTKQATEEARRSFFEAHFDGIRELVSSRATNERLNAIYIKARRALAVDQSGIPFVKALVERTTLTAEEAQTVFWDMAADWMCRLQFIRNIDHMNPEERLVFETPFVQGYSSDPIGRLWWETMKSIQPPNVIDYVERLLTGEHAHSGRAAVTSDR